MNPFEEEPADLCAPSTKEIADSFINKTIKQLAPIGQKQHDKFVMDMVDTRMALL